MIKRSSWRSQFGFYLIAIGSAFGLGNLWRFPYIVGENGGGAFLLVYVILSLTVGMTLMIAELMLGQLSHSTLLVSSQKLGEKQKMPFRYIGIMSLVICFIVLSYYSVVSGWVLHFLTQFVKSLFVKDHLREMSQQSLSILLNNGWLQFLLASVHIILSLVVVAKGVQEGLEKWVSRIMPLFALLVVVLVARALAMPSSGAVLRFLFYPDFSKLNLKSLAQAVGHMCFTLSIGFGTIVTFGSYMKRNENLASVGMKVTFLDTLISLVAVLLVFPMAFHGSERPMTDPTLLFEALPKFFLEIKGGLYFGLIFFLCLWLAALNASIGLLETMVANFTDLKPKTPRNYFAWMVGGGVLVLALFPALSGTVFRDLRILGLSLIEFLDTVLINWILPVSALFIGFMFYRSYKSEMENIFVDETQVASLVLYRDWRRVLRWGAPVIIILGLVLQVCYLVLS